MYAVNKFTLVGVNLHNQIGANENAVEVQKKKKRLYEKN